MNENKNICPCCGRGCDLSAPGCPRGEEYLRSGQIPARGQQGHGHRGHHGEDSGHGRKCGRASHYEEMDREEKLLTMIGRLHHISRAAFEGKGGQKRILHILAKDGAMTQRELTERLDIRPGSASEVIKKLEAAGLILRETNEDDRRTATVSLSDEGRAQVEEHHRHFNEIDRSLFEALSSEERDELLRLLEKLGGDWEGRFRDKPRKARGCRGGGHERKD